MGRWHSILEARWWGTRMGMPICMLQRVRAAGVFCNTLVRQLPHTMQRMGRRQQGLGASQGHLPLKLPMPVGKLMSTGTDRIQAQAGISLRWLAGIGHLQSREWPMGRSRSLRSC